MNDQGKNNETWGTLLYEFTQNTTVHGVRYITAETPYILRRIIWTLIVLTATSFFLWFMTDRLLFLKSYPKTVDVEVIYTDSVNFPAVTICNQNLFRTSATHKLGLHDIVEESFRNLQSGSDGDQGFTVYHDSYLEGIGRPHAIYVDVTARVCRHLCTELHGDSCCSVLYERKTRTCLLTPLEMQSEGVTKVTKIYSDYYHRKTCQVQKSALCTFEDGLCNFVKDFMKSHSWETVNEEEKIAAVDRPLYDHTNMTASGKYLLAATKFHQPNSEAGLVSPYILAGDDTCLQFYYQIRGGILTVGIRRQGNVHETVWSKGDKGLGEWEKGYRKLPKGYYRVTWQATSETNGLNIAIDDISIGPCAKEHACKESSSGRGYSGQRSTTASGRQCQPWGNIPSFIAQRMWLTKDPDRIQNHLQDIKNYCRNPDGDPVGPWCFTELDTGTMEYCDIPRCGCRDVEFKCGDGRCISRDMLCNNVADCDDGSDETLPCNKTDSITCDFDGNWMCGYQTRKDSVIPWKQTKDSVGGVLSVSLNGARPGGISTLVSPLLDVHGQACLHVDYYLAGGTELNIFYETDSYGYSKERLCSLRPTTVMEFLADWNSTDIMLKDGSYRLVFEAVVDSLQDAKIMIDNLTLLNENCTRDPDPVESTTMTVTTESDPNVTESVTFAEMTTQAEISTTTETEMTYHMPFEHTQCSAPSGECRTCPRRFSSLKDCLPHAVLVANQSQHVSSSCDHIGGGRNHTLATCEIETLALNGNVFNYRNHRCHVKLCRKKNFQLTHRHRGSSVYYLEIPQEPEHINCQFKDHCACGYRYMSSNVNDHWVRLEKENNADVNGTNSTKTSDNDYYLTVRNKQGIKPKPDEWSRLISPKQLVDEISCLRFDYYTRYVDITVSVYSDSGQETVMKLAHDGQQAGWHTAMATVPAGHYSIIFDLHYSALLSPELAGLDNILIENHSCEKTVTYGSLNCTFEDDDYCGYHDGSKNWTKWVRSNTFTENSPGGYYLRTSGYLQEKGSQVLYSPFYNVSDISCLQFYYFLQGKKAIFNTMSVSTETPRGERRVVWVLRAVTDNEWHLGQTEILDGYFRLIIEISGNLIRGGIDDITVVEGLCPETNCSMEEYQCGSMFACIPESSACDDLPNCYLGDDEEMVSCNGNETIATDDMEDDEGVTHTPVDEELPEETTEKLGSSMNLTEIYTEAGHQGEDLIYQCRWEGKECHFINFTKAVTDYGVCYTFNSEEQPDLKTALTGSRFGLSLALNIEQYEYMLGPQNDAGIKVFLHSKEDLPQVRDLGFAIPPGTHALVGVRLNEAENLPKPWGDCAEKKLDYYDKYVHSRCRRECETERIVKACGCRDAYMPSYTTDNPPVCNLSSYFSCAVPNINSVENMAEECKCPKPCKQTIYEPALSQAALSVLSVDSILSENKITLSQKYQTALEARQRVDEHIFYQDLQMTLSIQKLYERLRRFAKSYLGDFETSSFARIWAASGTLVKMFEGDLTELLGDLGDHLTAYQKYYQKPTLLLGSYLGELEMGLQELNQLLENALEGKNPRKFLAEVTSNMLIRTSLALDSFEEFQEILIDPSGQIKDGINGDTISFLPRNFSARQQEPTCSSQIRAMVFNLRGLTVILEELQITANGTLRKGEDLVLKFNSNVKLFLQKLNPLEKCLHEYLNVLQVTQVWLVSAFEMATGFVEEKPFRGEMFNFTLEARILQTAEEEVDTLIYKYSRGMITKIEFLQHFDPEEKSSEVVSHVSTFVDRIKSRLTDPLRQRIQQIRLDLLHNYVESFQKASKLEDYLGDHVFYRKASAMKIWRIPVANLDNPSRVDDKSREYWKVWDREVDIKEFATNLAPKYIAEGLDSFSEELLGTLDGFEEQLFVNKQKLLTAMEKIQRVLLDYRKLRDMDHRFVLDNFLNMDVYFAQLKHQNVKQLEAYQNTQFLGDIGGFMGLLLGGSCLTVLEFIDLIIFNMAKKLFYTPKVNDKKDYH